MKLSVERAREVLLASVGPCASSASTPNGLLARLRHIQLDPLDRIGTNADLVAFARGDFKKGQVYTADSFEHFAKERCLLPPSAFPYYREEAKRRPTWRFNARMSEVPESVCEGVLAELEERGPLVSRELSDHGSLAPGEHAWARSTRLGSLALQVLTHQCRVVVRGRRRKERIYDLPSRVLPEFAEAARERDFHDWALEERVHAAGLLSLRAGPWWGALEASRKRPYGDRLQVEIDGRKFLVHASALEAEAKPDERMRILGPLDPLIWNRDLVERLFGFTYLWEVYKPAKKRIWGYYVCPLLYRGAFVGRIEARWKDGMNVERVWWEGEPFNDALEQALAHLSSCLS